MSIESRYDSKAVGHRGTTAPDAEVYGGGNQTHASVTDYAARFEDQAHGLGMMCDRLSGVLAAMTGDAQAMSPDRRDDGKDRASGLLTRMRQTSEINGSHLGRLDALLDELASRIL
jgi:hypothetical protein